MTNQTEEGSFTKFNNWLKRSVTIRLLSMTILVLLLLIPTSMVRSLITEREWIREDAINEVSSKWGQAQTITGPVLSIPYDHYYKDEDDKLIRTTQYAHFLPASLKIDGQVDPERRYRGIHEVVVYGSELDFNGSFDAPTFDDWNISPNYIRWDEAFVSIGIPDMRGIQENIILGWNNSEHPFNPGVETRDVIESGVSVGVPIAAADSLGTNYEFTFKLDLNGSKEMKFTPLGRETNVHLTSSWPDPSFDGAFLPDEREISKDGFTADWNVLHLNRNYPQKWLGSSYGIYESTFGVTLLVPVDHYQKSTRSAKYAILIISLSFLIFFFIEILNKKRIHPIQYILVGLALIIFYALLLSFSEHMNFNTSYIIASFAVIGLVTAYAHSMFKTKKLTGIMGAVLIILHGFVFTLLQLQDYALLMGSSGLFIVLAIVMWLSRKVDWYQLANKSEGPTEQ